MINFYVNYKKIDFSGNAQYIRGESSFYYEPWNPNDFSIVIGNSCNSLDVDLKIMKVLQLTGFNSQRNWISKQLPIPIANTGELFLSCDGNVFFAGTGILYKKNWKTYYDRETGWICIGNPTSSQCSETVEFAGNTIAVVVKNDLCSVWIKPWFLE